MPRRPVPEAAGAVSAPRILVFSSLFPHAGAPLAGVFIRERMFRVARRMPVLVVSPRPWFPLQGLIRRLRPGYRPSTAAREVQDGVEVLFPRFLSLPVIGRGLDGLSMALCGWWTLRRLRHRFDFDLIDAHFGYPDGYAASLLGRWFGVPVTVTLRGTELRHSQGKLRPWLARGLNAVSRVFAVSDSLRRIALELGVPEARTEVIGNGVDLERFTPVDRAEARARYALEATDQVLVSVGGLVERKGFHRVIERLPGLLQAHPRLHYLVVGGPSPEGDWSDRLRAQVEALGLGQRVHFLGPLAPDELRWPLSAADLFVLATSNEGWANVFLEAMACGLPVVTTRVGGNAEVVCAPELGEVVEFGDGEALAAAIDRALGRSWDRPRIREYAAENSWDRRITRLSARLRELAASGRGGGLPTTTTETEPTR